MSFKVGIDVGGTFTDLFLWSKSGSVATFKTLSTPDDPSVGVLNGLGLIAESQGMPLAEFAEQVETIVHGTTVTTNATLTRTGAKMGLVTTEGVRDALEMRRGIRERQYDNRFENVVPLVPRWLRRPVPGRLDWKGEEITPLDDAAVRDAAALFRKEGVEAVAVCFMNAFANTSHEEAAAAVLREELPEAFVSVSTELLPVVRFYNRISTTALNGSVGPILRRYIDSLTQRLSQAGFTGVLLIMQSNGGVAAPELVAARPATTLLSGPAGGPCAAVAHTREHGTDDCILVDMGGTSFDASLVRGGVAEVEHEGEIERMRIALPMLAITTIGAGGGSVGWIDDGGLLRMGPESAGAKPGPACYGLGGSKPACTDANVVLGYLDPATFADGALKLDPAAARAAIQEHVAKPLGLAVESAAAGMFRVINTNMAHGVREITVKRGIDPREFPMVVAGGAGALHACAIANELDMPTVLVPKVASVLCAAGMLMSDLEHDFVRSCVARMGELDPDHLLALVDEMVAEGGAQLEQEGVPAERTEFQAYLDLRYLKQYHEVTVPVPIDALRSGDSEAVELAFHREHNRLFGYDLRAEGTELELISVRVKARGRTDKPALPVLPSGAADPAAALRGTRRAYVPEEDSFDEMPVFDGERLEAGNRLVGPVLIERPDTTILVSASFEAVVDRHGSCLLQRRSDRRASV